MQKPLYSNCVWPFFIGLIFVLSNACVTRTFSEGRKPQNGTESSLKAIAYDADKLSGNELWDLSQQNVFSPKVHNIEIKMNHASYASLYNDEKANGCRGDYDGKTAHIRSFRFDDVEMNNVGIKVRGNTSVCSPRLQFTLKFDKDDEVFKKNSNSDQWRELTYPDDVKSVIKMQSLYGLTEISLRRSQNDSSAQGDDNTGTLLREFVSSWSIAQAEKITPTTVRGAPVYRVGYAKVVWRLCNDDADKDCKKTYTQIYNIAENIGKSFFKMRWDDNKPTVYQHNKGCGFKAGVPFSAACYEPTYIEGKKFDETNVALADKARDLIDGPTGLMTQLKSATNGNDYSKIVDVDAAINYIASTSMVGHWDSALGNFNNDFVYFHKASGKWKFVTWDLDNTFGKKRGVSFHLREVAGADRPLFEPLFQDVTLNTELKSRFAKYLDSLLSSEKAGPMFDKIQEARDCYLGELNNVRPGQGKTSGLSAEESLQSDLCASKTNIWSTAVERTGPFIFIPDNEKQQVSNAEAVFEFTKKRYLKLKDELK